MAQFTLAELANSIDGQVVGDEQHVINNVATLVNASQSDITFLANSKYRKFLAETQAGCVLIDQKNSEAVAGNAIIVPDPYVAYAKVANILFPEPVYEHFIAPSAVVAADVIVGKNVHIAANSVIESGVELSDGVYIGPGCIIGPNVKLGSGTHLRANVTLAKKVIIGERVILHPGVVVGADGFGLANEKGRWLKIPQVGTVRIGNDVEVGANTTIDRGAIDDTIIADGVKLDNQIQIGHNVTIGEHTVVAGCVGIAGSTHIGAHCAIGGGTGMAGHITIAAGVQLMGMSMVTKSISESGVYASGIPIEPVKQWHKNVARYRKSSELFERLKKLEQQSD